MPTEDQSSRTSLCPANTCNLSPYPWRPPLCNSSWMLDTLFPCHTAAPGLKPPHAAPLHRRHRSLCPHRSSEWAGHTDTRSPPLHLQPACSLPQEGRIFPTHSPLYLPFCKWCHQHLLSSVWPQLDSSRQKSCLLIGAQVLTPVLGNLDLQHMQEEIDENI